MSGYEMGAFEALEWAWHMLRSCKDRPEGVEYARRVIHGVLVDLGSGDEVNFRELQCRTPTTRQAAGDPSLALGVSGVVPGVFGARQE